MSKAPFPIDPHLTALPSGTVTSPDCRQRVTARAGGKTEI
jgi:hypothetical protein